MKVQLTDANFDEELKKASVPVLVDFWAEWCGPCRLIAPVVDELAEQLEGKLVVGKLDVDQNQQIAVKYGVMSIPTLIVFKNGQEVKRMVGYQGKQALVDTVNRLMAS